MADFCPIKTANHPILVRAFGDENKNAYARLFLKGNILRVIPK